MQIRNLKDLIYYNAYSFIFFNLIAIIVIYLFTPFISGGFPFTLQYDFNLFSYSFGLEVLILVLGISIGIVIGGIFLNSINTKNILNHIWDNSFLYHLLLLLPAFMFYFIGKAGYSLVYISEHNIFIISFVVFTIFYTLLMIIMKESRNYSSNEDNNNILSNWTYSIQLAYKKIPSIIVLFVFLSIALRLRNNMRIFLLDILTLQNIGASAGLTGDNLHEIYFATTFLVISIQILILNIILFLSYLLIKMKWKPILTFEKKALEVSNDRLHKILLFVLFSISIIVFSLGKIFSIESKQKFLIFWSPYYSNSNNVNIKPSIEHWFGTDIFGRDVFSLILFSISEMFLIIVILLIILFIFTKVFSKFILSSMNDESKNFYDAIANFPSLPILIVIAGYTLASSIRGNVLLIFIIYMIVFWPRYIKRVEYTKVPVNNNKLFTWNLRSIISKIIIDFTLIGFLELLPSSSINLGLIPSNSLNLGVMLRSFMSGNAYIYWWNWFFPLLSLYIILSLLGKEKRFVKSP